MVSPSRELTAQFYEWEQRGRGWFLADGPVELEPAFEPFWGHCVASGIIDDGRRPHWLARLFSPDSQALAPTSARPEPVIAYGAEGDNALTVYRITLPRGDASPIARMEQLLAMLSYRGSPVSFEIVGSHDSIDLQCACRDHDAAFLYTQLRAFFPDVHVAETLDDRVYEVLTEGQAFYAVDFGLAEEFMRPLAILSQGQEPLTALFGVLELLKGDQCAVVQVMFAAAANPWPESIMTAVCDCSGKQSFFLDDPDMPRLAMEKVSRPLYGATVRAVTSADGLDGARTLLQHLATALVHASASVHNRLMPLAERPGDPEYSAGERLGDILLRQSRRAGMLLNSGELAALVHFPSAALRTKKVIHAVHTTRAAPASLLGQEYILGENRHQGQVQAVGLSTEQRLRHVHLLGATGTGKSTLLHSLIMQDIHEDIGLMCLDPHGDLIEDILNCIPESRIKDVVLIDPSDAKFPIALNILSAHSDLEKELLASDLVALFRRFSTSWGDQMNSVLANAILAFVYNAKQFHLGDLRRFLIETAYRTRILSTVTDADIVYYWQHEFPLLKGTSIGSILTRLDSFLRPKLIRNMVCQQHSLDFAQLMDTNKIVLVKLSQGLMGAENSYLLGAFIVSKLQQTAMARQAQDRTSRTPFFCYVDEFHHFITPSMAEILSGTRKYGLGLVLSHQEMQQVSKLDAEIAGSLLTNAGTRICFRLGDTDAKRLGEGFAHFTAGDLENLSVGEAIARVNATRDDFNLDIIPFEQTDEVSFKSAIRDHSRAAYSTLIAAEETARPVFEPMPEPTVPTPPTSQAPVPQAREQVTPPAAREHRYLQALVKAMAEGHGYKAQLEVPTPDGSGYVDVLLEREGEAIAVEVSVTTTAAWELHNVRKCLAAGYDRIVVCADQPAKRKQIQGRIASELTADEQKSISVIASAEIPALFTQRGDPAPPEAVMKGYRVKVNYESSAGRQGLVQSILNSARRPK
ncbi:type IV secretion system DNA-binding domain-containing protein [Mucilaginibacter sp. OK098]|uniref:type IV secretion system DNA-binding domain-containing protein n=1 Tax=Mucilaginibacter sp. OK098 TaxID=1855297 RepID=UPI00091266E4|nr:type IV secretion system DNA-binding domain-containing protein [Mucilaginibacter sp. OK098]SHN26214.1 AAA-like domain-containing protein [Mucilaginibacter sp. OK098]